MTYETLLERFLNYVKINTRSNPASTTTPSTKSQADFALTVLKPEMEAIGLQNIHYNPANGYLIGSLPANSSKLTRKIGFIAHMEDRKSTRLNSSHANISYAVFCLK